MTLSTSVIPRGTTVSQGRTPEPPQPIPNNGYFCRASVVATTRGRPESDPGAGLTTVFGMVNGQTSTATLHGEPR